VREPRKRRTVFSIAFFGIAVVSIFVFRFTKLRRTFYEQIEHGSFRTAWVELRRSRAFKHRPHLALGLVPPADLDIPVLGQLTPAQLPLGDTLEPGFLEVVSLDAPLRGGPFREEPLEYAPRDPNHVV
jgi:hypothetical protein